MNTSKNAKQIEYYQPGCVFRWPNFVSGQSQYCTDKDVFTSQGNICFHIYSVNGRDVSNLTLLGEEKEVDTILFASGSTFMVCSRVEKGRSPDGKTHIYIRQVQLGLGHNVVMWADDMLFAKENR